jgi:hypothetical protein
MDELAGNGENGHDARPVRTLTRGSQVSWKRFRNTHAQHQQLPSLLVMRRLPTSELPSLSCVSSRAVSAR